jgi:hypothetical protein
VNTITQDTPNGRIIVRMEKRDIERARRIAARYGFGVRKARGPVNCDNRGGLRLIQSIDEDRYIFPIGLNEDDDSHNYGMTPEEVVSIFKDHGLGDQDTEDMIREKAARRGYRLLYRRNVRYWPLCREPMTLEQINELCDKGVVA